MGLFRWQLAPYCNVVTLGVTQENGLFSLAGFDDQCGAGQRASVVGTAFPNPDGTIGIGLNTVTAPGGSALHVEARISLATLGGPWRDSAGRSGSFVFAPGGSIGGSPRPTSQHLTKVFQPAEIGWILTEHALYKYREAVLSIPEITQTVVDGGIVQVHFGAIGFPETWTALPNADAGTAYTIVFLYSVDVGKVVVRIHVSTNVDPGVPSIPIKVSVSP